MNANRAHDSKELGVIAYHEAGHAVALLLLRRGNPCIHLKRVSIIPDNERAGGCDYRYLNRLQTHPKTLVARVLIERLIIAGYAGPLAEAKFRERLVDTHFREYEELASLADQITDSEAEKFYFLAWLRERANILISSPPNWLAVQAVAEELLKRHTLRGVEVKRIVKAVLAAFDNSTSP